MNTLYDQELRMIVDDLVAAWPSPIDDQAIRAARRYVRTHCRACGARLPVTDIAQHRVYCRMCSDHTEYEQMGAVASRARVCA